MHNQYLGVGAVFGRSGMNVKVPELSAQRFVLLERQLLVAKEQHEVIHQAIVDRLERLRRQWCGQVDAGDLGANHGRNRVDMHDGSSSVVAPIVGGSRRRGK